MTSDQIKIKSLLHLHPFKIQTTDRNLFHGLPLIEEEILLSHIDFNNLSKIDPRITRATIGSLIFIGGQYQTTFILAELTGFLTILCGGVGTNEIINDTNLFKKFLIGADQIKQKEPNLVQELLSELK